MRHLSVNGRNGMPSGWAAEYAAARQPPEVWSHAWEGSKWAEQYSAERYTNDAWEQIYSNIESVSYPVMSQLNALTCVE
jgi:hypothetical protein